MDAKKAKPQEKKETGEKGEKEEKKKVNNFCVAVFNILSHVNNKL